VDVGQYASRAKSHVGRQQQIHRLRHVITELCSRLPEQECDDPMVREMMGYGCKATMDLANLLAPRLDGEEHTKDIDFARSSIRMRWQTGFVDAIACGPVAARASKGRP
jgi:NTE family protein